MAYYLNLFSPKTLAAFNKSGKKVSGFRERHEKIASKIRPGDKFICYVTEESRWVGILDIKSKKFFDNKPIFTASKDPFVVRFKVKPKIWLSLENAIPIHEDVLWNELSFTKGQNKKSNRWTGKIRGSLVKLSEKDGQVLKKALMYQQKKKIKYLLKNESVPGKKPNTRDIGNELHDRVESLFQKMGMNILRSDYNLPGPDIIIEDPELKKKTKILIQCKRNSGKEATYSGLHRLVREYASWVREEKAALAIIVLSGYKIETLDQKLLEKSRVLIWTDGFINSYEKLVKIIGKYSKYQLFSDLGLNLNFETERNFEAFQVNQNNSSFSFYVFKADPEWLLKSVSVLRRMDWGSDVRGYQRVLEKKRLDKLVDFFKRDDWSLPNTLIFSGNPGVLNDTNVFNRNRLTLPSRFGSLWIMDGQHRLYGFSKTDEVTRKKNELVCVFFDPKLLGNKSEEKQANVFIDINMNVKKVSTALLLELLQEFNLAGVEYGSKKIALDIVTELSKTSIFKGFISGYSRKGGPISLTTFVTNSAMQRLVAIGGPILKRQNYSDKEKIKKCVKILKIYFSKVSHIFQKEWGSETFALSSDKGIRGLLGLLIKIFEKKKNKDFSKFAERVLKALKNSDFDFEVANFKNKYAGEGGANLLVQEWLNVIGSSVPEFSDFRKKDLNIKVIPKEEDDYCEFKSSLRWNIKSGRVDKEIETSVLKTINAFLNSEGGDLFIGVDDKGKVVGLKEDYLTFRNKQGTRDDFRRHLSELVRDWMKDSVMELVSIKFGISDEKDFCMISVEKSPQAIFTKNKELYYRSSASSISLKGEDLLKYVSQHWKKD